MINNLTSPSLNLRENLDTKSYTHINNLQKLCLEHDRTTLKLELDYKLSRAEGKPGSLKTINEFMCYDGELLIGYIGICDFGGVEIEVNGMVHPDYRKKGIFKILFSFVKNEWSKRRASRMLLLSDRNSLAGQAFIKGLSGVKYEHTEYEMFLQRDMKQELNPSKVVLRKATGSDTREISRQNSIYFEQESQDENMLIPEEEAKAGMIIYIAEANNCAIGKIHLDISSDVGGIYGLGVLPEYRRKGYGRDILTLGIAELKSNGFKEIMLQVNVNNEKALDLYRSCGFEVASTMDYHELKR